LGWVNDGDGKVHLYDMKAIGNSAPKMDTSQDLKLIKGYQNESHTVITFQRPWQTCDTKMDMELNSDTTRLIWAYHQTDPWNINDLFYHGAHSRGVRSVFHQELPQEKLKINDPDLKIWDLTSKVELPNNDHTHYWC
jgi:hypothetical protein